MAEEIKKEEKKQSNRVKSTAMISGIMSNFYAEMGKADKVCWCVGACPYEMFTAAGVARFQTENHAARISSDKERIQGKFIEIAEQAGISTDCCSYAKINIGVAILMTTGRLDEIPERHRIPAPDMVFALNTCPSMIQWANVLGDIFKVPVFTVDAPYIYDEKNWDKDVEYVKAQLGDLVTFLEQLTGRPYDWNNLTYRLHKIEEMTLYRRQGLEQLKKIPAPASFFDGCIAMGPGNTVRDDLTVDFYREFNKEIADRAAAGICNIENERYRLMWRGNFPWQKIGVLNRMMTKYDATIVNGPYAFRCYGDLGVEHFPPNGFDYSDPLKTIATDHCCRSYTRTLEWKMQHEFYNFIEGFHIDGVIIHSPRTCRPWALTAYDMAKTVEEKYHIPVLILEADHTDPQYFNDAQVENQFQGLLERIDANRSL